MNLKKVITAFLSRQNMGIFIIILITTLAYINMLPNNLVFDDHYFIEGINRTTLSFSNLLTSNYPVEGTGVYRPVRNIIYAILIPIFGKNPLPYHFFTLALHLVITFLLFKITIHVTKNKTISLISSILFGLHPIHVESVSWITAGFDLIFVVFYLACFYSYITNKSNKTIYTLTALSIFSNEIAITLPITIFLYEIIIKKIDLKTALSNTAPLFFIAFIYWTTRFMLLEKTAEKESIYPLGIQRFLLPLLIIGNYIKLLILPINLSTDHLLFPGLSGSYHVDHNPSLPPPNILQFNQDILAPIGLSLAFILITIYLLFKKQKISYLFIFFLITILPVASIVPIPILFTERYVYLASISFILFIAFLISRVNSRHSNILIPTLVILISSFYFNQVYNRNKDWNNDISLWESALKYNKESVIAYNSMGTAYAKQGDDTSALKYYEKSISLNPYRTDHQNNLQNTYDRLGMYQKRIDYLKQILEINPNQLQINYLIGTTYEEIEDYSQAKKYYQEALNYINYHPEIEAAIKRVEDKIN